MAEGIVGLLAIILPFAVWAIQRRARSTDAQAPERHQQEVDRELASPDKRKFSDRLSRLFDRAKPPADPQ